MINLRKAGESDRDYVLRMHVEVLFQGATHAEIAEITGVDVDLVASLRDRFDLMKSVAAVYAAAGELHAAVGYDGTLSELLHDGLRAYARSCRQAIAAGKATLSVADAE